SIGPPIVRGSECLSPNRITAWLICFSGMSATSCRSTSPSSFPITKPAPRGELFNILVCPVTKETKPQQEQQVHSLKGTSCSTCGHSLLHADSQCQFSRSGGLPCAQHSPFILARLHRRQSLSTGL